MRMQVDKKPKPLLEVAAGKAFWRLNADLIDKLLAKGVGVTVEKGTKFPERVLLLVQKVLGCSREEGAEILEARVVLAVVADGAEELLASGECQAMVNKGEQQEMDKFLEGEAKTRAGADDFATLVRSVRVGLASKARKTRKPVACPTAKKGALDEEYLTTLLPDGFYIRRNTFNGRWGTHHSTSKWSFSRSWGEALHPCMCEGSLGTSWQGILMGPSATSLDCWVLRQAAVEQPPPQLLELPGPPANCL